MTDHFLTLRRSLVVVTAAALTVLSAPAGAFEVQGPQGAVTPQAAKPAKPAVDESNPKVIVRLQTELINSGNLDSANMAKSLLRRGTAHYSLGHYAAALADLTGAIFIGTLSDAEMREAYRERAKAYGATGQTRLAEQDSAKASSSGSLAVAAPATGGKAATADEPDSSGLKLPAFKTSVVAAPAEAEAPAKSGGAAPAGSDKKAVPAFRSSIVSE